MKITLPKQFIDDHKDKGLELFFQGLGDEQGQIAMIVCGHTQFQNRILTYEHKWNRPITKIHYPQLNQNYIILPPKIIQETNFKKVILIVPFQIEFIFGIKHI